MSRTSAIRVGKAVCVVILLLVLSLVLISSLLVGEHHCNEEHCVICLLSSNMTAWGISIKAFCTFVLVISVLNAHIFNNNRSETLITLKRKLTI